MKIIIYDTLSHRPYNPRTLFDSGIGGQETSIILLAKAFHELGHAVKVYVNCDEPNNYAGVDYYHFSAYQPEQCDIFIGSDSFPAQVTAANIFNWVHRMGKAHTQGVHNATPLLVSEWQKLAYNYHNGLVVPNGVDDRYRTDIYKEDLPFKIVYAGFPGKGGMMILPKVKKALVGQPVLLSAYGGGAMWGKSDATYANLYKTLKENGINYGGQVGIIELSEAFKYAHVFLYPVANHHRETFCLVIAQAMAAGCVVIASGEGNNTDLIGDAGFTIYGNIFTNEWTEKAKNIIVDLVSDKYRRIELSNKARERVKDLTWKNSAQKIIQNCKNVG